MRLPEHSSSQRGAYAIPIRGRDSLSYVQPPGEKSLGPLLDPTSGAGFFRPNLDFPSIFNGTGGTQTSAPSASQSTSEPPLPSESPRKAQRSDSEENDRIDPSDEDEDEAVEENDSIAVQPLAIIAEATVETPAVDAPAIDEVVVAQQADPVTNVQTTQAADQTSTQPVDQAIDQSITSPLNAEVLAQADTDQAAESPEVSANGTPATDVVKPDDSPDSIATAVSTTSTKSAPIVNESVQTGAENAVPDQAIAPVENSSGGGIQSAETLPVQSANTAPPVQATPQNAVGEVVDTPVEPNSVVKPIHAQATTQPQRQINQTLNSQTPATDGQNSDSVDQSPNQGRNRTTGGASKKGTNAQIQSSSKSRAGAGSANNESASGVTNGSATATDTTTNTSTIPDPVATAAAPNTIQPPLAEAAMVAGQAASTPGQEAGVRPASAGGTPSELAAIRTSSSDGSGTSGDHSSGRTNENLSRTDIADRARLIHRISKAFTKMGTDGGQIRMKMHPEELGGVLLEMRVRGRNVEATVTADNEAARGILQQQLSELRQRLEGQGLTVQRLEVALRDESATGSSLLNDHRGEMFGGDRGSDGHSHSRHPGDSENAGKRRFSPAVQGAPAARAVGVNAQSLSPAAPGSLDLRL